LNASRTTRPESVDEYLALLPEDRQALPEKLRAVIKAAAPKATETISYRMPTYKYLGRPLVGFAVHKNHVGFYAWSSSFLNAYREEIKKYQTSVGTLRFAYDRPLPVALVRKLVKAKLAAIEERSRRR
jgi:uncharacterized protein YdhG (YjbR/CyaY superfamily)